APRRAVERDVADDDVVLRDEGRALRRVDDHAAAREPLREVVVGVPLDLDRDAIGEPGAEALTARAGERDVDGVGRQALRAPAAGDLGREHGAHGAVAVRDRQLEADRLAPLERRPAAPDDLVVERLLEAVVLWLDAAPGDRGRHVRGVEYLRQVHALRLPVPRDVAHVEHVDAPDHVVDGADAERGHDLAQLLGDEHHEVDHVLGLALELPPQHRVLGRDADRAGVEMADAHHDAARGDQRGRGEAVLLGAEERRDGDVTPGLQLPVGLDPDAPAEIVGDQDLLRLGEAELPGDARVLDRGERGGARAPESPLIKTTSAFALETPAATVPTPTSATSFTLTRARSFAFLRSWISCARSSIE